MSQSGKQKRFDRFEIKLTPKEWAIHLADEKRRHSSEADFLKAIAKGTYRESPYFKPFFVLAQQSEERHSGADPAELRARDKMSRNVRKEFQGLKLLITHIDKDIRDRAETNRRRTNALAIRLQQLILQDAFLQTSERARAWMERRDVADVDEQEERRSILQEFGEHAAGGLRSRSLCLAQDLADGLAMILAELLACKTAIHVAEEKYFDGHLILSRDVEAALEMTIQLILDVITTFNGFLNSKTSPFRRSLDRDERSSNEENVLAMPSQEETRALGIDVESIQDRANEWLTTAIVAQWVNAAKNRAIADILQETGEHEAFVWDCFKQAV